MATTWHGGETKWASTSLLGACCSRHKHTPSTKYHADVAWHFAQSPLSVSFNSRSSSGVTATTGDGRDETTQIEKRGDAMATVDDVYRRPNALSGVLVLSFSFYTAFSLVLPSTTTSALTQPWQPSPAHPAAQKPAVGAWQARQKQICLPACPREENVP